MDFDGSSSLTAKYLYGNTIDNILMVEQGVNQYYYHKDGVNSVGVITDSTGAVVESYTYDVYGKATIWDSTFTTEYTESTIGNRYMFTGREWDNEIGLYYYRARFYSPELGRFLQTDPLGYYDSSNLYQYCHNNPVNWVDPFGNVAFTTLLTSTKVIGTVAGAVGAAYGGRFYF